MTARSPTLESHSVLVYSAHISALDVVPSAEIALRWLDAGEMGRYQRFRHDDDRQMFLLGRVMARTLVGRALGVPPRDWQWTEGPHGRPDIARPETPLRFNISHSARLVVCALATGRDVGVDVENLDRRAVEPSVVARYFAPNEIADINVEATGWERRFLSYWTLKEAYLKARGLGISVHLADIAFAIDQPEPRIAFTGSMAGSEARWRFHLAQPTPQHVLAVAVSDADGLRPAIALRPFDAGPVLGA
jgi:4'-phosphopantetheinyl transferase